MQNHNQPIILTAKGVYYLRAGDCYYIGMTTRAFHLRWTEHINDLVNGTHSNYKLQQAYNDGELVYCGVLLMLSTRKYIKRAETILIQYYKDKFDLFNLEGVTQNKY